MSSHHIYTGRDSMLYAKYKQQGVLDKRTGIPDAFMSVAEAAAWVNVGETILGRQLHAGLLKARAEHGRNQINALEAYKLNFDKNGVRQIVKLETGERRALRRQNRDDTPKEYRAREAIMYYPEWLDDVNEELARIDRKRGITSGKPDEVPRSFTGLTGDKTGEAAAALADMNARMKKKALWVKAVYNVCIKRQWNIVPGLACRTFLELTLWGSVTMSMVETADTLRVTRRTATRYMHRIIENVLHEAYRLGIYPAE